MGELAARGVGTEPLKLGQIGGIFDEPEPRALFFSVLHEIEARAVVEGDARGELPRERRRPLGGGDDEDSARAHEVDHDRPARLGLEHQILAHPARQAQELAGEALGRGGRGLEERGLADQDGFNAAARDAGREVLGQHLEKRQLRQ